MTGTSLPNRFKKEVTWLKSNKWAINLFWLSSDLYLYHQIKKPEIYNSMKIVNSVSS